MTIADAGLGSSHGSLTMRAMYLDSLHALGSAFSHEEITLGTAPAAHDAVKAALRAARRTSDPEAGILAACTLARAYYVAQKRDDAAAQYREAVRFGTVAAETGVALGSHAAEYLALARDNLGSMADMGVAVVFREEQPPPGKPITVERPGESKYATIYPTAADGSGAPKPVERETCDACGKKDLALLKCAGTCKPSARYCDAACQRNDWKRHKAVCGSKKR
ncbi:hypothetical protein DFJ74DRAFT_679629 [Hyaloraphidium curvatum]|nr:hypothetical protein DFJ74DRAFT_679629 [Hyaloraphidium curvatum]